MMICLGCGRTKKFGFALPIPKRLMCNSNKTFCICIDCVDKYYEAKKNGRGV